MIPKFRKSEKDSRSLMFLFILIGLFTVVVIGFLVVTNLNLNQKRKELNSQIAFLEEEIQDLEEQSRRLKAQISQTSQEDYTEKILREKGLYKKPGEQVIVITKEKERQEAEKEESFLERTSIKASTGLSHLLEGVVEFFKKIF